MQQLKVKKLDPRATLPTCAHPGEDLGFDIYALEDVELVPHRYTRVRTGIAVEMEGHGFIMRERSSMAQNTVLVSGGTIDAGYRGEMFVNLTYRPERLDQAPWRSGEITYHIQAGDRIGQFIPIRPATQGAVLEVSELSPSARGTNGYGSTGR